MIQALKDSEYLGNLVVSQRLATTRSGSYHVCRVYDVCDQRVNKIVVPDLKLTYHSKMGGTELSLIIGNVYLRAKMKR